MQEPGRAVVILVGVEAGFESPLGIKSPNAGQTVQGTAEDGEDERLQRSFADLDSSGARNVEGSVDQKLN